MARTATYSTIISPREFNRINTQEHLYIRTSDGIIKRHIEQEVVEQNRKLEVVELGCGPARVLSLIGTVAGINLTGVDHDENFLAYAREQVRDSSIELKLGDINQYQHQRPVDIFYSQGVHHHMAKPPTEYLRNAAKQLNSNGKLILSDEFLPDYHSEEERRVRATIWYSHIINHALRHGHTYLAQEETKTLLDELNTEIDEDRIKTPQQIELVLQNVGKIDSASRKREVRIAEQRASDFLISLEKIYSWQPQEDPAMGLSRGDYKICDRVLREEISEAGLKVKSVRSIGPIKTIGAMSVYLLEKG